MLEFKNKTDEELVRLSLQNTKAFDSLIRRYEKKLLHYIRCFTGGNKESAEDILQEAFIKMYHNLNSFNTALSFSAWAYRITHNEAINYIRKNKKHNKVAGFEVKDENINSLIEILPDKNDIISQIKRKDLSIAVAEILDSLPSRYREVLILRFFEEKDYFEISYILKCPMGTVATLLNRAKKEFQKFADKNNLKCALYE